MNGEQRTSVVPVLLAIFPYSIVPVVLTFATGTPLSASPVVVNAAALQVTVLVAIAYAVTVPTVSNPKAPSEVERSCCQSAPTASPVTVW